MSEELAVKYDLASCSAAAALKQMNYIRERD